MLAFRDLTAQYLALKEEIDANIAAAITRHDFIFGKDVLELESELAAFVGVKHCVTCGSGTDALILSLKIWNIGPGDAVFVPDYTFFASANCILLQGATPVLVDIDEATFNLSPDALQRAVERVVSEGKLRPRAVIAVDLFGLPAAYDRIRAVAERYGMLVLEDGAQGFGGMLHGKRACALGDLGATSFFPSKPLGCYGDGGAIFTNDDAADRRLRSIRAQGRSPEDKYDNRETGLNSRLDTLQAAILLPKLRALREYELDAVNRSAAAYGALLDGVVVTPTVPDGYVSSWAQYTILLNDAAERDGLKAALLADGIPTMIYYPRSMHEQTALSFLKADARDFPVSASVVKRCLSLPMHPYLTESQINEVAARIRAYLKR